MLNMSKTTKTAKAISTVTYAIESTGRLIGKGSKAFVNAVRNKPKFSVEIVLDQGVVLETKQHQTKDDIKSLLNTIEQFKDIKLIIQRESNNG